MEELQNCDEPFVRYACGRTLMEQMMLASSPEYAARVISGDLDNPRRVGSGIFVTPDQVLTCAHVAFGEHWREVRDGSRTSSELLWVARVGKEPVPVSNGNATIWQRRTDDDTDTYVHDMALLRVNSRVCDEPAVLVENVTKPIGRQLFFALNLEVYGFHGGALHLHSVDCLERLIAPEYSDAGTLLSIPIATHVVEGYSGGPVTTLVGQKHVCIGMATLGGTGRILMVGIGADHMLSFLRSTAGDVRTQTIQAQKLTLLADHRSVQQLVADVREYLTSADGVGAAKLLLVLGQCYFKLRWIQFLVFILSMGVPILSNWVVFLLSPPGFWGDLIQHGMCFSLAAALTFAISFKRLRRSKYSNWAAALLGLCFGIAFTFLFPAY